VELNEAGGEDSFPPRPKLHAITRASHEAVIA
jgi:hypothetical protein